MSRTWAIVERELRRFRRSPILIVISMVFPLVQLVILGYAMGGNVKHLKVAIVDQDGGLPAVRVRELAGAVAGGANTFDTIQYADQGAALDGSAERPHQRRVDDSSRVLPPGAAEERAARRAHRGQHRQLRLGDARRADGEPRHGVQPALGCAARVRPGQAGRRRGVPLRPVRAVPAARLHRDVDFHDGDDRRRHHLHRRQGARAARRVPGYADHQARARRRLQHLGDDQGGDGRHLHHDHREPHRGDPVCRSIRCACSG